ncbi:hypothetical protein D3C80_2231160 [compost metagenome]
MTALTAASSPPARRRTRAAPISVVHDPSNRSNGAMPVTALMPAEKNRAQSCILGFGS